MNCELENYITPEMDRMLFANCIEMMILRKIISPEEITMPNVIKGMKQLQKILEDENIEVVICTVYSDDLLKKSIHFYKNDDCKFSITIFATWLEHWINEVIYKKSLLKNLPLKYAIDIIRNTQNNSKYTWLLSLLDLPPISPKNLQLINKFIEKRNAFVHYKWQGFSLEQDKIDQEEDIFLCKNINKLSNYLKKYKNKNLFEIDLKKLRQQ